MRSPTSPYFFVSVRFYPRFQRHCGYIYLGDGVGVLPTPKVGLSLPRIRLIPRSRHRHLIPLRIYLFSRENWEQIYSTAAHLSDWIEEKKT